MARAIAPEGIIGNIADPDLFCQDGGPAGAAELAGFGLDPGQRGAVFRRQAGRDGV